jgi:two-component system response regulator AtoC
MRVLFVEDSRELSHLFSVTLRRLGHEAHIAPSEAAARQIFRPGLFDFAFVDIGLESDDGGLEIIDEIKVQEPNLRVGVLSSNDLPDMVRRSKQVGAEFYMVKPFTPRGLGIVLDGDMQAMRSYVPEIGEGRLIVF